MFRYINPSVKDSPRAALWRALTAAAASVIGFAVIHTLLAWVALQWSFFYGSPALFELLFALIWLGHGLLLVAMLVAVQQTFKDPTLLMVRKLWLTTALLVSLFFIDVMYLPMLLLFLSVLAMGMPQQPWRQVVYVALYALFGALVVFLVSDIIWPDRVTESPPWLENVLLTLGALGVLMVIREVIAQRDSLLAYSAQLDGLLQDVQARAVKDPITEFFRLMPAMALLSTTIAQSRRAGKPLALAYVDVDQFKRINTFYKQEGGDQVLRRVAHVIRLHTFDKDIAARVDAATFMVVMPGLNAQDAQDMVGAVVSSMASQSFDRMPAERVTVSAGVTLLSAEDEPETIVSRAQRAMEQAQQNGGNQWAIEML